MVDLYENVLYKFQKNVVDKAMAHNRFFLALEPGLGKTFTSLSIFQKKKLKKLIIVAQSSKLDDWAKDVREKLWIKTTILNGGKAKDEKNIKEFTDGAIIASYQTIWRREQLLKMLDDEWMIIIDETQYLKSRKSSIGEWGLKVTKLVKHIVLLTGTPLNKPEDLFVQMKMLGMDMDWNQFSDYFLIITMEKYPGARWPAPTITGYKNQEILFNAFRTQSVSVRTSEAIDLPMQVFTDIHLTLDNPNEYKDTKKYLIYKELLIPSHGVLFLRLRQMASGFIEEYKEISSHKKIALRELLESNENNFNIFYNFKQELADIKEICKDMNIDVFEFNGDVKSGYDSIGHKKRFVIASQYLSGAAGLNLQHVSNQLYYSPPLSFIDYKQSLARIHRIGQSERCFYYFFKTKNTVEEKIYKTLAQGQDYDDKMFAVYAEGGDDE